MNKEKNVDEITIEELLRNIKTEKRIFWYEEYHLIRHDLLNNVKRILDLRHFMKTTKSNCKRVKKIINKYAKSFKKEKDTKKLYKKLDDEKDFIIVNYIDTFIDLMKLIYKILNTESFDKDTPSVEKWYEFEMDDMVLVNGIIKELDNYNSKNITEEDILKALDRTISKYVSCIEEGIDYSTTFGSTFPYVQIKTEQEE